MREQTGIMRICETIKNKQKINNYVYVILTVFLRACGGAFATHVHNHRHLHPTLPELLKTYVWQVCVHRHRTCQQKTQPAPTKVRDLCARSSKRHRLHTKHTKKRQVVVCVCV